MVHDPIEYHWAAASVPPPYHDEFDILIHESTGVLEYFPGYRSPDLQPRSFYFSPDPIPLAELTAILSDLSTRFWVQADPLRVGGAQEWLRYGDRLEIPPDLQAPDDQLAANVFERVRALVPPEVWDAIRIIREINQK